MAMSHTSYFFLARSSRIDIEEPAAHFTISKLLTVTQLQLGSDQISNAISYWKSINTWLLEVIISSKNQAIFIRDLNDLTLQIIFDAIWTTMNVDSTLPIAWNNSRSAPSWRFYLHCRIEETSSPGIRCIVCYQVFCHPSEHGTSSMGKHLLPKAHIANLHQLTESEVSELTKATVDETAIPVLIKQGSRGITIVMLQLKLLFNILSLAILTVMADKTIYTGKYGLWNCRIPPRHLEPLPHVRTGFSTHFMQRYIKPRWVMVI